MTKASDLFIQCLEEEDVEYISGLGGMPIPWLAPRK